MESLSAWMDRDNITFIQLTKEGAALTSDEMDAIAKVELRVGGEYFGSDDHPTCFDLTTKKADGKVGVRPGLLPLDTSIARDLVELVVYDSSHTNGIVWMQFLMIVKTDAEKL